MNSLRQQLLLRLLAGLLVVLGVSGVLLYLYLRHVLVSSFDIDLFDKAHVFAKTTEIEPGNKIEFEIGESNLPQFTMAHRSEFFQVWDVNGATMTRSPSLDDQDLPAPIMSADAPALLDVSLPDGSPGRIAYVRFVPRPEGNETVVLEEKPPTLVVGLAVSTKHLLESLARVRNGLLLTGLALVLTIAPTVWWSLRRGLHSIDTIGERANAIDMSTLPLGFSSAGLPRELVPVATRLNDLLRRLQTSFARERRFTADAAHELRTPIAELRTLAEIGLGETATHPGMNGYFKDALAIAEHLEKLVSTLLALARCESGLQTVHVQPINASQLVESTWNSLGERSARSDVRVNMDLPPNAGIQSDPDLLKTILNNLFANAVSHVSNGGRIDVAITPRENAWVIGVSNTTHGLKSEELNEIFKPFWRKEQNIVKGAHCGLGLSLVAAYASLLGILVHAEMPARDIFRIEVICPQS